MSTNKTKKVKMATKSCPECDQQVRKMFVPIFPQYYCRSARLNITLFLFYFLFISLTIKTEMGLERLPRFAHV